MDEQEKRALAERFAALVLMVPTMLQRSVRESLTAVEMGEAYDEQVRALAAKALDDLTIDWDSLKKVMDAKTVDDLIDPDV